jgi:general stress protein 26
MENTSMTSEIREAFWHALEGSPFVMLRQATFGATGQPMTAQLDRDAHHTIWFFAKRSGGPALEMPAQIDFACKGHKVFAALSGNLHFEHSRAQLDKLWSNQTAAWFPAGKDDPDLGFMRFEVTSAEVWQADLSVAGKFHLMTGTPIQPEQAGEHAVGLV